MDLALRVLQVSLVGQGLDPKVASHLGVVECSVLADLHDHVLVVLLDVIIEQLLFESELLAADLDTVWMLVNLEQKQHIVFVDFGVVSCEILFDFSFEVLLGLRLVSV